MTARPHWDRFWEAAEPREWRPLVEERLGRQLRYVIERSAFYREKLGALPFDFDRFRLEQLPELPFTTKDEVRRSQEATPPLGAHACVGWDEVVRVHASSGTTGRATLLGVTRRDREMWNELIARCCWATGCRPQSRAWVPVALGWWIAGLSFVDALQHLGAAVLPSGHTELARTLAILQQTGADWANSTPTFARHIAVSSREQGVDLRSLGVRHLALGGEPGAGLPEVRGQLEEEWGAKVYDNMGTADFCTLLWAECEAQQGMHFLGEGFVIVELLDPDTNAPIEPSEGAVGELVYTAIERECTPLIRFKVGDLAQVLGDGRCSCGRTSFRIRCIGRSDDMLICQGMNIYPSAVADVVASFRPQTTGRVQIEIAGAGPAVEAPVPLVVEHESGEGDELRAAIEGKVRRELLFRASVRLVPPGTLTASGMKQSLVRRVGQMPRIV